MFTDLHSKHVVGESIGGDASKLKKRLVQEL
jgi:hypothetical protein